MNNEFEDSFNEFSKDEDMMFVKDMLLQQASELQDCYKYIFDFNRQHPDEELATVLEYVRLCGVGLERAYDVLDDKLFDKSEQVDYYWTPTKE